MDWAASNKGPCSRFRALWGVAPGTKQVVWGFSRYNANMAEEQLFQGTAAEELGATFNLHEHYDPVDGSPRDHVDAGGELSYLQGG